MKRHIAIPCWCIMALGLADLAMAETAAPVQAWISTPDLQHKLSPIPATAFSREKLNHPVVIEVDADRAYQTVLGMGSSLEHSTCYNISLLPSLRQQEVVESIVGREQGIGMNLMRICLGTPDFTASPWYSYDDPPGDQADPHLEHFSIDKDRKYVLPILKLAQKINPDLQFVASPWSPPAWMKTNRNMCGGSISAEYFAPFADYLARSLEAYQHEGLNVVAVTPQNEPEYSPATYPSCGWTAAQQRDFIRDHLGPTFVRRGLATKIWCYDHNFNHPEYPATILADPQAAKFIDGTAFHHYEGKPAAMAWLHEKFPAKQIYFTEGSVFGIAGAVRIISYLRNWASSYNAWVTVIDHQAQPNPGPHHCAPTCIVLNSETLELEYRFDYYMVGQFTKYIARGAVRIDSTASQQLPNVAFQNPDRSIVLVIVNPGRYTREFSIRWKTLELKAKLEPTSVATWIWSPSDPTMTQ